MKSVYLNQPMCIIFDDYSQYSEFCKYVYNYFKIFGYVGLYEVLKFCGLAKKTKEEYEYGYDENAIRTALVSAELHKFKRPYKTDGTWPIAIYLPIPKQIKIREKFKEEI